MGRPKKTKITLDKDSLRELMQEIYNDCSTIQNSARKELNERKSRADIEDNNDEYQIGKVNNETLKILESMVDKKIALAKLQSTVVSNSKSDDDSGTSGGGITEEDKELLRELIKKKEKDNNTEYDLGDE
jgi:hypothetical protein